MKTSKKLMIGFTGMLVFLMLFSAILLRVNYSKGITNMEQYNKHEAGRPDPNYKKDTLSPFRVLVLTNGQADLATTETHPDDNGNAVVSQSTNNVSINHGDAYTLEHYSRVTTRQSGDTLFVKMNERGNITLTCPSLNTIHSSYCNASVNEFKQPRLQIIAGPKAGTGLYNCELTSLVYTGEMENNFFLGGENKMDSIKVTMGKNGSLRFDDLVYKVADISVDSLKELGMYGRATSCIKQIH
ncbi:hypothetical protein ACTJJ0_08635 [Chitinophaga sp. 22321]|uniref:Auto-transporter adhesin head GIN domain-containing protein n=1 Tax=Chitinophaga hostae TaxID=2831022 RepID=A0ABS5IW19_9BACT|nr:hypothetical protein [Chitinophaga hostae]MBS0026427.1 hypothetical protein [Chitinophaga hostae]